MQVTSGYMIAGRTYDAGRSAAEKSAADDFAAVIENLPVAQKSPEGEIQTAEWSAPWLSDAGPDPASLLLSPAEYLERQKDGSLSRERPKLREFMDATGLDAKSASSLLYGVVGAAPDLRNWDAILKADDPASAARQATAAQLNSPEHVAFVNSVLKAKGYEPVAQDKIVAQAGNFAVIDDGVTPSGRPRLTLRVIDGGGFARGVLGWTAPDILAGAEKYGIALAPLRELADQLDARGVSYMPFELYNGSDRGVDLRALAEGGVGTAYDWTFDPLVSRKGVGAMAALNFAQELASRLALKLAEAADPRPSA